MSNTFPKPVVSGLGISADVGHLKPVRVPSALWGEWPGDFEPLLALSASHNLCGLGFIVFVIQKCSKLLIPGKAKKWLARAATCQLYWCPKAQLS